MGNGLKSFIKKYPFFGDVLFVDTLLVGNSNFSLISKITSNEAQDFYNEYAFGLFSPELAAFDEKNRPDAIMTNGTIIGEIKRLMIARL